MDNQEDKKHRHLFEQPHYRTSYGDYEDEDSSEDEDEAYEQNVFNQQNAFGTKVFPTKQDKQRDKNLKLLLKQYGYSEDATEDDIAKPRGEPTSMFRMAIKNSQLGLAYLMLDSGYNYMGAMKDAMDESMFQLVLTLLAKVPDDSVVQQKSAKGENLFHVLSQNSS